jgi:hypothetical protein
VRNRCRYEDETVKRARVVGKVPLSAESKSNRRAEIKVEALAQAVEAGSIISFEVSANEPVQLVA